MPQLDQQLVAKEAIEIQKKIDTLIVNLEEKKAQLRNIANGETLKITVTGHGEVSVTKPRKGGEKTGTKLILDEDRINKIPELKQKLIEKGVIIENDIISTAAAASVKIKPNV